MKKKVIFVALILFSSLALLQYFSLAKVMKSASVDSNQIEAIDTPIVPTDTEIYQNGDYIILKKDGQYFFFEKKRSI